MSSVNECSTESYGYRTPVSLNAELTPLRDHSFGITGILSAKARSMSRVFITAALALAVTACSQGAAPPSLSLNDSGSSARRSLDSEPTNLGATERGSRNGSVRLASLNDRAPHGSFEKAPHGALAGHFG